MLSCILVGTKLSDIESCEVAAEGQGVEQQLSDRICLVAAFYKAVRQQLQIEPVWMHLSDRS